MRHRLDGVDRFGMSQYFHVPSDLQQPGRNWIRPGIQVPRGNWVIRMNDIGQSVGRNCHVFRRRLLPRAIQQDARPRTVRRGWQRVTVLKHQVQIWTVSIEGVVGLHPRTRINVKSLLILQLPGQHNVLGQASLEPVVIQILHRVSVSFDDVPATRW